MTALDYEKLIAEATNPWAQATATAARIDASFVATGRSVAEQIFLRGPDVVTSTSPAGVVSFAADKVIADLPDMARFRVYMIAMMQVAYVERIAELQLQAQTTRGRAVRRAAKRRRK